MSSGGLYPFPYGTAIQIYGGTDRAIGKTYDLIKYASENGFHIVSTNPHFKTYVQRVCDELGIYEPTVVYVRNNKDFQDYCLLGFNFVIDELEDFMGHIFNYNTKFRGCSIRAELHESGYLKEGANNGK